MNLHLKDAVIRYYLMMACVIGGVLSQQWWLVGLALSIFLTAITGICPIKFMLQKRKNGVS